MSMVGGLVTVSSLGVVTAVPPTGPNLAYELYLSRKAAQTLPDPSNPKGCILLAPAAVGSTIFSASCLGGDLSLAYNPGDQLGTWNYVSITPVGGVYVSGSVTFVVVSATTTTLTVSPAVPDNFNGTPTPPSVTPISAPLPAGSIFGYDGPGTSLGAWSDQVSPTTIKMLQTIAMQATADADTIVAHIQANAVVSAGTGTGTAAISTSLGGLQTSTTAASPTAPPATSQTIPVTVTTTGGTVT